MSDDPLNGIDAATGLWDGDEAFGPMNKPYMGVNMTEYLGTTWEGFLDNDNVSFYALDMVRMGIDDIGKPRIPKVDAQRRLQDAGIDYDPPSDGMTEDHIKYVMDYQKRKAAREEVFARNDSTLNYALSVPTYVGAMITDPLQVASAFFPVIPEVRYAAGLAKASGIGGRAAVRAGYGAVEGTVGALALEPFVALQQTGLGNEYSASNSLANAVFGGVFGSVAQPGVGLISDLVDAKRLRAADAIAPVEERAARLRDTIARLELDLPSQAERLISRDLVAKGFDPKEVNETILQGEWGRGVLTEARETVMAVRTDTSGTQTGTRSFKTAKGSEYEVHADGSTSRNKSYHPEHGKADQGPQPKSDATFYVSEKDAVALGEFQTEGFKRAVAQSPDGSWGVRYLEGPDAGKFERRTMVKASKEPKVGMTPVEVWKDGTVVHFGNKITEVATTSSAASRAEMKAAGVKSKDSVDVAAGKLATHRAKKIMERDFTPDELFSKRFVGDPNEVPPKVDEGEAMPEQRPGDGAPDPERQDPAREEAETKREQARKTYDANEEALAQHLSDDELYLKSMEEEGLITADDKALLRAADEEVKKIEMQAKAWQAVAACMVAYK